MIYIKKGDLLESDCNVIIHQANCFTTMGSGIAKQIKAKYPEAYQADLNYHIPSGDMRRLGGFSVVKTIDGKFVVNMYSQFRYGKGKLHTDYSAFQKALKIIMMSVLHSGIRPMKIGMPYNIGCGLAGGDWNRVLEIIDQVAEEKNMDIYLYKL